MTLRKWMTAAGGIAAAALALASASCRSTWEHRDPTGEAFPDVVGESLAGERVELPAAFRGKPVIFLVGYLQSSQFDIDRWLFGLSDAGVRVDVRELPTLPGLLPGAFAEFIDSGMRRGIPSEDWGAVVTVYGDADRIAAFTGNREGLPARVLVLDREGRVAYFHDRGYSVGALARLRAAVAAIE